MAYWELVVDGIWIRGPLDVVCVGDVTGIFLWVNSSYRLCGLFFLYWVFKLSFDGYKGYLMTG